MASKTTELSIVLKAVDHATAPLRAINDKLDRMTKPMRDFGEAFGDLGEKSGLSKLTEAFGGVGDALGGILAKAGMLAGVLAAATAGVFHLIDGYDELGDASQALGVSADFLAQMRYAADKSGVAIEKLDNGLKTMAEGVGQAKAGTGRLASFLGKVSPALLRQLKATKSNEEAFDLLANAMARVEDPAKKAAFAQKVFGDSATAPLLAKGAAGVKELRDQYLELAPGQAEAVAAAGEASDALKDFHASVDGVKAALVTGLAPALTDIVKKLTDWLSGHRGAIKDWAIQLGKKIPAAFEALVAAVSSAIDFLKPFFDSTTKIKIALGALVAVIVGPLIASLVSLGIAIMTTPIGWFMAAVAAIAAIVYEVYKHWDGITEFFSDLWDGVKKIFVTVAEFLGNLFLDYTPIGLLMKHWGGVKDFFTALWDGVTGVFQKAWDFIAAIVDKVRGASDFITGSARDVIDFLNPFGGGSDYKGVNKVSDVTNNIVNDLHARQQAAQAQLTVKFDNAPKGTRIETAPSSGTDVDLSVGYNMGL